MKNLNLWRRLGAVMLSGVLLASMGMSVLAEDASGNNPPSSGEVQILPPNLTPCGSSVVDSGPSGTEKLTNAVENEVAKAVDVAINNAVAAGGTAEAAKAATVVHLDGRTLGTNMFSINTMRSFQNADVNIEFSYDYNGYHYVVMMPAGQIPLADDVPWYGPLYLAHIFRDYLTITPIAQ